MGRPFVTVVTGRPGSGKTTLAHQLANQIHCPALCRDEFKEGYVHTSSSAHGVLADDVNWRVYNIFFETVDFVVSRGVSVVIEAAFQHQVWVPKLTLLAETASVSIVICTVDPHLARSRSIKRAISDPIRERFHGDKAVRAAREGIDLPIGEYEPPKMNLPTLLVDTTDEYRPGLLEIAAFALQAGAAQHGGSITS